MHAKVDCETKEIQYLNKAAKTDDYAQEIINETLNDIDNGNFENVRNLNIPKKQVPVKFEP